MRQAKLSKQHQLKKMSVAIVHDSYLYQGGAERVLLSLLTLFPQADVYIPLIRKPYLKKLRQKHRVFTSIFNLVVWPEKYVSFIKPFILWYWRQLNLSQYNLVISSSHSFSAKSVKTQQPTLHIAYIHTPPRYLYQEFNEMSWLKKPLFKWLFAGFLTALRKIDYQAAQRPDILITNSKTTQQRIAKYYQRASQVIYPPVILPKNKTVKRTVSPKYYLFHSRLVKQKGAELVIRAFNQLKKPLVVVGEGSEKKRLQKLAQSHIIFKGFLTDKNISKIYKDTKALVYGAVEEDFGLVPVEAMSYGVPVIAYASGGVRETVSHGKTGLLFNKYSLKSLTRAVKTFEQKSWSTIACTKQAQRFSENIFRQQFLTTINRQLLKQRKQP
ncbi:MAG: glycosyl transferase group 1 [Candidatus Pacebacteria bacterium GW2011_GWA1_46_10]|nr:MAG: glycosyl transferase group 1 [Candidatus Pacebacteria bacterium GW2011_GWA1_46_10]HCR80995.1 glycosyltransferase family 4 protein [Candidatus Paceibacterota bacterium]